MIELQVDDGGLNTTIRALVNGSGNFRRPLSQWVAYMNGQTISTFNALRTGGTYRGVTWPYFKPQYTRKTDGVTVPAWGGVPTIGRNSWISQRAREKRGEPAKVREGRVKGRKRPSGKRLKQGDALMQDTCTLLRSITSNPDIRETSDVMIKWGSRLHYAEKQQKLRRYFFATDRDKEILEKMILGHMMGGSNG